MTRINKNASTGWIKYLRIRRNICHLQCFLAVLGMELYPSSTTSHNLICPALVFPALSWLSSLSNFYLFIAKMDKTNASQEDTYAFVCKPIFFPEDKVFSLTGRKHFKNTKDVFTFTRNSIQKNLWKAQQVLDARPMKSSDALHNKKCQAKLICFRTYCHFSPSQDVWFQLFSDWSNTWS